MTQDSNVLQLPPLRKILIVFNTWDRWQAVDYKSNNQYDQHILWESQEYYAQWTWHEEGFCSLEATSSSTSRKNSTLFEADPADFIECFLTQDEFWVHHFETKTVYAVETLLLPYCKDARVVSSARMVMSSFLGWRENIVHWLFSKGAQRQWRVRYQLIEAVTKGY